MLAIEKKGSTVQPRSEQNYENARSFIEPSPRKNVSVKRSYGSARYRARYRALPKKWDQPGLALGGIFYRRARNTVDIRSHGESNPTDLECKTTSLPLNTLPSITIGEESRARYLMGRHSFSCTLSCIARICADSFVSSLSRYGRSSI
jgi:hypothetical protein